MVSATVRLSGFGIGKAMSVTSREKFESGQGETIRVVIHALLIALVIRTFLFQPFNIPSGSMKATLLIGDYLFVSKYSYGYSHYSIPLSPPLFSGRIFGSSPSRGDVVVFRLPNDNTTVYTVPPGHFFMMGDNRDNSTDSRVLSAVGYVPLENIIGRAQMIFFSVAEGEHAWMFWRWPWAVRWNRLFKIVR